MWSSEEVEESLSREGLRSWAAVQIPNRLRTAGRVAVWLFVLLTVAVAFIPWTQTIKASGRLSAYPPFDRPQDIHAQITGRIKQWHVLEGEEVNRGELIVELEDVDPKFLAPELLELLQQSKDALAQTREAAVDRADQLSQRIAAMEKLFRAAVPSAQARVLEAENKIRAADQQIVSSRIAYQTAQLNVERHRRLAEHGLVSQRELEVAEQTLIATRADLKAAQAALSQAKQAKRALTFGRDQVDADMAQRLLDTKATRAAALAEAARAADDLAAMELRLSNAVQRRRAARVTAPIAGTVVRMARVGAGEVVNAGDRLVRVSPLSQDRAVELWARGVDAPLLRQGRKVRLLFEGMPAIPLPGWPELMAGTFGGEIKVVDQLDDGQGNFRFWVIPDPDDRPWPDQRHVRQGSQVIGWVVLNRVPLWYELWRRFNLFPPDYEPKLLKTVLPKAGRGGK
ncbi:MAG: HlyD family efflux transporter periplasmic adaptor subunit [Nitrococcus mobilis]|nr:HlyD family efflux transporter periplasmic adaptor subunit [Nitrococcus mobilis]